MPPSSAPPTPSWARGKNYDKTLVRDIDDLVERQKHKATAENLRQKLLRSQKKGVPNDRCQTQDSRATDRLNGTLVPEPGVTRNLQATGGKQDAPTTNAGQKSVITSSRPVLFSTPNQQSKPPPSPHSPHPPNPTTIPTLPPESAAPNPTPPHSAPLPHPRTHPLPHKPVEASVLSHVDPSAKVKKKTRRLKKGRIHKMIRQVRRDVLRIAEADRM